MTWMLKRSLKWKEAEHVFLLEVLSNEENIYTLMILLLRPATTAILERYPPCGEST